MIRRAIYAGSFDPITNGHISVIFKASLIFDYVIVLIADNPDKVPFFSVHERLDMITHELRGFDNVSCDCTSDIVVNYARRNDALFLVRGVRGVTDLEYENLLANLNKAIAPEITTVFVPADMELSEISSSNLKFLASKGKSLEDYCTPHVQEQLSKKMFDNRQALSVSGTNTIAGR